MLSNKTYAQGLFERSLGVFTPANAAASYTPTKEQEMQREIQRFKASSEEKVCRVNPKTREEICETSLSKKEETTEHAKTNSTAKYLFMGGLLAATALAPFGAEAVDRTVENRRRNDEDRSRRHEVEAMESYSAKRRIATEELEREKGKKYHEIVEQIGKAAAERLLQQKEDAINLAIEAAQAKRRAQESTCCTM